MSCTRGIISIFAAAALLGASGSVSALTVLVPGDAPDIQSGINLADNGDTVLVAPGTYSGDGNRALDYGGIDISVIGSGGSDSTIIDLTYDDFGFIFHNGEPASALLQGFTITHADSFQGANVIDIWNGSSPTFRDIRVTGNNTTLSGSNGIVRVRSGSSYFDNCVVDNNYSEEADGIVVVNGGDPTFNDCLMTINKTVTACLYVASAQVYLTQTTISFNQVQYGVYADGEVEMTTTQVLSNSGDGVLFLTGSNSMMDSCLVEYNAGAGVIIQGNDTVIQTSEIKSNYNGGIKHQSVTTSGSQPYVANTVISGNVNTSGPGGGIIMDCTNIPTAPFAPIYDNCTITGNSSAFEGGGVAVCGAALYVDITPVFQNCTISANLAASYGGGIHAGVDAIGNNGLITMDQTILWGNCSIEEGSQIFAAPGNALEISCSDLDSSGTAMAGEGDVQWGPSTVFTDPIFCQQPACDALGTTGGDFSLSVESPVDSGAAPCQQRVGANGNCPNPVSAGGGSAEYATAGSMDNYPNPFNPTTAIRFNLKRATVVELSVYDVRGRLVRNLINSRLDASEHAVEWRGFNNSGNPVAAGVYFAVLRTSRDMLTRKLVLIK